MIQTAGNSNTDVDWRKQYDYYEIELRDMYKTRSKPQNESHFEMLHNNLGACLTRNKIFAEVGFGAGITLRYASKYFSKVYGLDISPKNVKVTKKELSDERFNNIELYASDIMVRDEKFKEKFDVISFIHGLEHFSKDDYQIFFENVKYYLKEGGVFTGALPNNLPFNYRMCPNCDHVFEIDGHVSVHTVESLQKLFETNDFSIIHISDFNINYDRKHKGTLRYLYKYVTNKILKREGNSQLEFIAKPLST